VEASTGVARTRQRMASVVSTVMVGRSLGDLGRQTGLSVGAAAEERASIIVSSILAQGLYDPDNKDLYTIVFLLMSSFGRHRRPFVTSDGRLGLGPLDMKEGDCVAVIIGTAVPFLLRKTSSKRCLRQQLDVRGNCQIDRRCVAGPLRPRRWPGGAVHRISVFLGPPSAGRIFRAN